MEKKCSLLTLSEINQNTPVVQRANIKFGQQDKMAKEELYRGPNTTLSKDVLKIQRLKNRIYKIMQMMISIKTT